MPRMTMAMKHLISVVLLLQSGTYCAAQDMTVVGLSEFSGKDLRKLDKSAMPAFEAMVEALTGDTPDEDRWRSPRPWGVAKFGIGDAAWVLVEGYPGYDIPDVSWMRLHVFDAQWKRIRKQEFPTGYRMRQKEILLVTDSPLGPPLLAAKVASTGPLIVEGEKQRSLF